MDSFTELKSLKTIIRHALNFNIKVCIKFDILTSVVSLSNVMFLFNLQ